MANSKHTGNKAATVASKTLRSASASSLQKSLAGTVLSQAGTSKQANKQGNGDKGFGSVKESGIELDY